MQYARVNFQDGRFSKSVYPGRKKRGALLATSEIMIIVPLALVLLYAIIDGAILACCKLKLGAVCEQSAKVIADIDSDKNVEEESCKFVAGLLKAGGQQIGRAHV